VAITGAHCLIYTPEAGDLRDVFRDVFGFEHVDAGGGWLIFNLPPAEVGVHPSDGGTHHALSFMCDDIETTMKELSAKGIEFRGPPADEGFGIATVMNLPGGVSMQLYQPHHPTAL